MSPDNAERRPADDAGAAPKSTATTTSHSLQLAAEIPPASSRLTEAEASRLTYVAHFQARVVQDALTEATSAYWIRRARQFEAVGNDRCDEVALACRARASVASSERVLDV